MKNLLILITIMLVGGCGKDKETQTKTKVTEDNNATKPVKELTLEEKVVGTYEMKVDEDTLKGVFLENGVFEFYENGKKNDLHRKWSISKDGEIHLIDEGGDIGVFSINPDGSITGIASIDKNGEREDAPKEDQQTAKKIK